MFSLILIFLMFVALIVQNFLGVFPGLGGQILLLPVVFFYAAAALPLWGMLAMAYIAGFMWDCLTAVPVDGKVEFFFGWTILLFGALGAVMNGLRPLFIRGRWQIHCLVAGILTSLLVLIEFAFLTFRREPFQLIWPITVWRQILGSGIAAALISPVLFFSLNWIGRRMGVFERARIAEMP
jgi:hypothetical protein